MSTDPEYPPQSSLDENNQFVGFDIEVGTEIATPPGREDRVRHARLGRDHRRPLGRALGRLGRLDDPHQGAPRGARLPGGLLLHAGLAGRAQGQHHDHRAQARLRQAHRRRPGHHLRELPEEGPRDRRRGRAAVRLRDRRRRRSRPTRPTSWPSTTCASATACASTPPSPRCRRILDAIKRGYPLKVVGEPLFKEPLAVAIDKGDPEFTAKIAEIVKAMHADGTLARLSAEMVRRRPHAAEPRALAPRLPGDRPLELLEQPRSGAACSCSSWRPLVLPLDWAGGRSAPPGIDLPALAGCPGSVPRWSAALVAANLAALARLPFAVQVPIVWLELGLLFLLFFFSFGLDLGFILSRLPGLARLRPRRGRLPPGCRPHPRSSAPSRSPPRP